MILSLRVFNPKFVLYAFIFPPTRIFDVSTSRAWVRFQAELFKTATRPPTASTRLTPKCGDTMHVDVSTPPIRLYYMMIRHFIIIANCKWRVRCMKWLLSNTNHSPPYFLLNTSIWSESIRPSNLVAVCINSFIFHRFSQRSLNSL